MVNEEQKQEEHSTDNSGNGDNAETSPLIKSANDAAERLEKATEAQKKENDRAEELMHRQVLGGQSEGGFTPQPKAPETNEEFTERFEKGQIDLING